MPSDYDYNKKYPSPIRAENLMEIAMYQIRNTEPITGINI